MECQGRCTGVLLSYKIGALPRLAPFIYSNFASCQHFCKPGNANPLILSTGLALNSCGDTSQSSQYTILIQLPPEAIPSYTPSCH